MAKEEIEKQTLYTLFKAGDLVMKSAIEATQEKQGFEFVPYQLCPKCNGQGSVSKPGWVPGDVDQWTSSAVTHLCDICNGSKIIPMFALPQKPEV